MLPITSHKGIHIPHSLATAAAIIALVTALSWNSSTNDTTGVESAGAGKLTTTIATQETNPPEEPAAPARTGGVDTEPGVLSGLLPLVLPNISGF